MSRVGRNSPCPCGSGRKAKRCCTAPRGPSEPDLARAQLAHHARRAARTLAHHSKAELRHLFDALPDLPSRDLTLLVALPDLISPALNRLNDAIKDGAPDAVEDALPALLATIDTPQARARLATAIANLHAAGRIDQYLAAAAHIDLDSRSDLLISSSLVEAAAIAVGAARTPAGLLIAAA